MPKDWARQCASRKPIVDPHRRVHTRVLTHWCTPSHPATAPLKPRCSIPKHQFFMMYAVQAISGCREFAVSEDCSMAWILRSTPKRCAPEEPYPQTGSHFHKFSRARLSPEDRVRQRRQFLVLDSLSPWLMYVLRPMKEPPPAPRDQWPLERKEKLNPPLNLKNRGLQKRKNKARTLCQTCPSRDEEALRDSPISSTDLRALQQWRTNQARINSIIQDMDALGRSCRKESTMDFQPADHSFNLHRPLASVPDVLPLPAVRPAAKP